MASTDAKPVPQKNVAYRVTFPILDADGDLVTGATGLDSEVSKDGGTFTDCGSEATEIASASGVYYLDLTNTEMNADTVAIIVKTTSSGAKTTTIVMYPEEAGDIRVNVTAFGGTAGTFASGRPDVNTTHAAGTAWGSGAITSASIAADAITDAKVASDVTIASVTGSVGSVTGSVGSVTGAVGSVTASVTVGALGAGVITAASIASDAITDAKVASDVTIASVTGSVGSVTGAVGSVTGSVGSVTGAVGSVTGNVGGNLTGTIGGLTAAALADFFDTDSGTTYASAVAGSVVKEIVSNVSGGGGGSDPWLTLLPGSYGAGSAGKIVGDNLNATVSSRATQTSVDTIDDFLDTEIAAIKAKTDALPADPADASDIAASFTAVNTKLDTIDDFVDTEIANIQSRLPAALVSGRMDASVGAMATGVITATSIAADAITDAKVASDVTIASVTGAVGSVTGAVGSVTGNVGGNVNGNVVGSVGSVVGTIALVTTVGSVTGSVGSVTGAVGSVTGNVGGNVTGSVGSVAANGITASSLDATAGAEIADAVLDRDMATGTDSGSASVRTPRQALRVLRNKWSITGSAMTVTKEDDSTTSWSAAVTGTPGADPITTVDPA